MFEDDDHRSTKMNVLQRAIGVAFVAALVITGCRECAERWLKEMVDELAEDERERGDPLLIATRCLKCDRRKPEGTGLSH